MRPVKWKELVAVCESEGCRFDRQKGDHYIMTKPGLFRPVVIPRKNNLKEDVVLSVGRTIGLTKKQIEERITGSKSSKANKATASASASPTRKPATQA